MKIFLIFSAVLFTKIEVGVPTTRDDNGLITLADQVILNHLPYVGTKWLVAYWPLDDSSGAKTIVNTGKIVPTVIAGALDNSFRGPGGQSSTSHTVKDARPNYLAHMDMSGVKFNSLEDYDFTVSFYFYADAKSNAFPSRIFSINGAGLPITDLRFEVVHRNSKLYFQSKEVVSNVPVGSWVWYAFVYTEGSKVLRTYNQFGLVNATHPIWAYFSPNTLSFGQFTSATHLACVSLFQRALTPIEMIRLPCLCRKRGNCNGTDAIIPTHRFKDEVSPNNMIGFWPFHKETGIMDVRRGKAPFYIADFSRLSLEPGPFGTPGTSFTTSDYIDKYGKTMFATQYDEFPFNKNNFTVSFHYFPKRYNMGGTRDNYILRIADYQELPFQTIYYRMRTAYWVSADPYIPVAGLGGLNFTCVPERWNFYAWSFDANGTVSRYFGPSTGPIEKWPDHRPVWKPLGIPNMKFVIGKLLPGERLSCLGVWNSSLTDDQLMNKVPRMCAEKYNLDG